MIIFCNIVVTMTHMRTGHSHMGLHPPRVGSEDEVPQVGPLP